VYGVEIGYIGGIPDLHGQTVAGFSSDIQPHHVSDLSLASSETILVGMIHPTSRVGSVNFTEMAAAGLRMVRIVYHPMWDKSVQDIVHRCRSAGLLVAINIALITRYSAREVSDILHAVAANNPDIVFFADTCSALLPNEVASLCKLVLDRGFDLGLHTHDFLSLALANSLAAIQAGARYIDASLFGIGRGAGNLKLEALLVTLSSRRAAAPASVFALKSGLEYIKRKVGPERSTDLISMCCGALNLTPPQEDFLRELSNDSKVQAALTAVFLGENPFRKK